MADTLPLERLFNRLRNEGIALSVRDYLDLNELIFSGVCRTRRDLLLYVKAQWATSLSEYQRIAEESLKALPDEFDLGNFDAFEARHSSRYNEGAKSPPGIDAPSSSKTLKDFMDDPGAEESPKPSQDSTPDHQTDLPTVFAESKAEDELDWFYSKTASDVGHEISMDDHHKHSAFTFAGMLPVPQRQIDQAWRRYRQGRRIGARTLLDIPATIEAVSRSGILIEPVMIAEQMNIARVVLLIDVGGSMIPFKRAVSAMIASAQKNNKARVELFYFHDVPYRHLYSSSALTDDGAVRLDEAVGGVLNTGILIVSDAGAARGRIDEVRLEFTVEFLETLRRHTRFIAWLNPMPRERWYASTAGMILNETKVPMFHYDRTGLTRAIALVRGASQSELA